MRLEAGALGRESCRVGHPDKRRAIGARRRDIFTQILGTALFLGALASITAIAITATAIYLIVPTQIPPETAIQNPTFPWTACAWGILAAATTAVIGAATPALKASRLPIAQALRT